MADELLEKLEEMRSRKAEEPSDDELLARLEALNDPEEPEEPEEEPVPVYADDGLATGSLTLRYHHATVNRDAQGRIVEIVSDNSRKYVERDADGRVMAILEEEELEEPSMWQPDGKLHLVQGKGSVLNADGSVEWEEDWQLNTLADEGEQNVLQVFLQESAHLSKYLCLLADSGIAETDSMASMVEALTPGTGGYARQAFSPGGSDWGAPVLDAGDYQTSAVTKTFGPCSGTAWSGLTHAAIVTAATGTAGKFLLYVPLSAPTTVSVGQSFAYSISIKAQ